MSRTISTHTLPLSIDYSVAAFLRGKAEAKALEKKDSVYEEQRIPTNKDEGQQ